MALGRNITFPIYNDDGSSFHGLELRRSSVESLVMSLSDKITGDVYYDGGVELEFTMKEYVMYNDVKYTLVSPPTIVREGMTADNSELKGTTKYSFEFYHPMYWLANYPFSDIAVTSSESRYKSQDKSFSWIGTIVDYVAKLNKNLEGTEWVVSISSRVPQADLAKLSEVLTFNNNSIADALKTGYDTYSLPYVIDSIKSGETYYSQGKRFLISFGLPPNEIYDSGNIPYVFQFGKGVGLKNNSRTPRKNKIITRIAGYGSENNIPYGYPQIVWTGSQDATQTADGYPLYDGIVGGLVVKLIKHPFTRSHLMPSVYVDRVRRKVNSAASDYNPNIELIDYYDADSSYPNPINPVAPNYEIHEFSDIKPELGQESIVSADPLNQDLTPASDWDDTMDDDGNYLQSYFQITLPILSFDIYACAAITEAMQINMRSGGCIGCTFDVQVDWDDYKKNFFDSQGNFLPNGEQRDLTKYPKSNEEQISIIVQKDLNTFGTLMPNRYQYPQSGDDFVVLGISLPTSYITNAQTRLDSAMQSFMLANNVHYFDYPLKFDEYFLATRTDLLSQIRNNSILRFAFGSEELELFVKQIVIKYGQGVLPQYDITLTDDIEVVLNQIGQVQEDVDNLTSIISALRQSFSNNVWVELSKKLSKVSDDTARGFITFLQGLQVGQRFTSGLLGEGGVFRKNADGSTYIEADSLYIRMKAYFDTLEVRKLQHSSGNRVASAAGIKAIKVEKVGMYNNNPVVLDDDGYYHYKDARGNDQSVLLTVTAYRCYFRMKDSDDNPIDNDFVAGDLARSQEFNLQSGLRSYWRKVVRTNGQTPDEDGLGWIDLSDVSGEYWVGSGVPQAQDDIVQLGNVSDTGRQGAIIEYSTGGGNVPSYQIYQGINTFSLDGKNYIDLGYNPSAQGGGRAYMNVRGDFRFGSSSNNGSYINYNSSTGDLSIKAAITGTSTIDGSDFDTYVKAHQNNYDDTDIYNYINEVQDDLQGQIDGAIETISDHGEPTGSNDPYASLTPAQKLRHVGDMYYDIDTGFAYRYVQDGNTFYWLLIEDSEVQKAVADAAAALLIAGGKGKIFTTTAGTLPTPPYSVNDVWVNATYPSNATSTNAANHVFYNDILKCVTARAEGGTPSINDWALASKYTDDATVNGLISQILNNTGGSGDSAAAGSALYALKKALVDGEYYQQGGLVLANLMAVRDGQNITAGINGHLDANALGGGIAAWYGGLNLDKEDGATQNYAKSLFRFDGSGYLAGGNITWDANGIVTIANVYSDVNGTNVAWSGTTLQYMTNLSNILPISIVSGTTYLDPQVSFKQLSVMGKAVATQEWVTTQLGNYVSVAFFNRLFQAYKSDTISDANKVSPNDVTSTINNLKLMVGTWTESYLSSLGLNSSSGGGGGATTLNQLEDVDTSGATVGQVLTYTQVGSTYKWTPTTVSGGGGLDPTAMWAALATSGNQQIDASHLSDALGDYLKLEGGTLMGGLTTRTITPASNNTYNLGSSGTKWSTIYTNDIYSNDFTFNNGGWLTVEGGELGYRTSAASGNFKKVLLDGDVSTTDTKVTQTATTTSSAYELLFSGTADNTTRTEGARKTSTLTYNPSTKALVTGGTINGYTLAAASAKAVVTSIDTSASLPTSNAVKTFVEGKGYATQTWVNNKGYAYSSDLDDYVLKAGDTMTGDLTIHDSVLYFTGGAAGRKAWINKNGTLVFQTTTSGGWATGKLIVANDGSTDIGYSDGAFGSANTLTYYFYGGNYDSPWVVLKPNSSNTFNMGIGTTSPSYKLHVNGSIRCTTEYHSNGVYEYWDDTNGTPIGVFSLSSSNNFWVGYSLRTGNRQYQLRVGGYTINFYTGAYASGESYSCRIDASGNFISVGDVTALSDIRHKSQISDVNTRIEEIANLPLFYFKWKYKDDDNMHIGTSAQAVQKLFPELVLGGEELSVNYGVLGTTLGILNSRKLTEHERRILDLEKGNKALRREINKLKGVAK